MGIVALFHCASLKTATQSPSGMAVQCGLESLDLLDTLIYVSAPDPARGRGGWPWHMAVFGALALQYIRHCPLFPCTVTVSGAAGHNRGDWRRRRSSQGHKAGPLIVLFDSHHQTLSQGGFLVCIPMRLAPGTRTQVVDAPMMGCSHAGQT